MMTFKISWPWNKKAKNEGSPKGKKKRIYHRLKKSRQYHADLEMETLGQAIDAAKDIENPDFRDLYSIYDQIRKDRHLKSQVKTAINDIQQSPFLLQIDGKDDDELKELFDTEWFDDSVQYFSEAEFWGHSLLEYPDTNEEQVFNECFLIPRENVNPALSRIILDYDATDYLNYEDQLEALNLVEIFGLEDLGDYEYLAEEVILKKYARTDWSQASEKYGMPFLKYRTDTEDKKELDAIAEACTNFAANGWIITNKDDDAEIVQPAKGDFYKIYMEAIASGNQEMSKAVNGQTATGDAQSFVGTAEMHERIKNTFTKARLRRVQHHVNGKLIPLMIKNGYKHADKLAKARFLYIDLIDEKPQLATEAGEDPDNPNDPNNPTQTEASGKKKVKAKTVAAKNPLDEWLERFFNDLSKSKAAKVDPLVWKLNFESLVKAMASTGISWSDTYQYADLAAELRTNAATFAAFKNHDEQAKLRELLIDENGEPRSLSAFKKAAKPLTEQYNKEWLETEYKQAQASSQMAVKWESFKEEADLYPNLRYDHSGNPDGRPDHMKLNGLVLPINDPAWSKIMPPNGWGCACDVVQTDEPVNRIKALDDFEPDKGFDFNPGQDQQLFSDNSYQPKTDATGIKTEAEELLKDFLNDQ